MKIVKLPTVAQKVIVQTVLEMAPLSRADLARVTGLSKQTVSDCVAHLEDEGVLTVIGQSDKPMGRRAVMYGLNPAAGYVAGVDLGGTKIRLSLVDFTGQVIADLTEPTTHAPDAALVTQIRTMLATAAVQALIPLEAVKSICLGVPGVPDPITGRIAVASNLPALEGLDLIGAIGEHTGANVYVENDANLAAFGEFSVRGDGKDLAMVALGTGIGAGFVIGGTLLRGMSGAAGEVAFLPFGSSAFDAEVRDQGALEQVTATHAIQRLYLAQTGTPATVPEFFAALREGEPRAQAVLEDIAKPLGQAIAAITAILDPASIVFGGSIGMQPELRSAVATQFAACAPRPCRLEPAQLGTAAGVAGGGAFALAKLYQLRFGLDRLPNVSISFE